MVERFQYDNQRGANWFEPNYYDGPVCQSLFTYLSTHFIYEAFVALYHNNSQIVARFKPDERLQLLRKNLEFDESGSGEEGK